MVFNFIDKNNVGSTIKNNGSTQTKKQPVIGTLFSCVKEAVPETAPAYYFYYVREENKLYAGQGSNKPLKEINTGSGASSQVPGTSVDLSDYATNDSVTAEINAVKALIPDIKEYMKTTDVRAALNLKADTDNVYDKETVNRLINEIKSGTVDMDLYVKKEDADRLYAAVDHVHDDVYTKTQTDSQISAAIAQAELNGGSGEGVDLSGFLKTTDAENTYLKKTDALTSDTVQSMIDGAGHLTSADISGFITKETADATYQQIDDYTDRDTVQSMIDNAGHLTAADLDSIKTDIRNLKQDVNTAKADIAKAKEDINAVENSAATATAKADAAKEAADTAKQTAEAAKTKAEQAAQNAQDAKTKAESVETIANDAKTKAETAKTTAEAAQSTADTAKSIAEGAQAKADANETNINNINANITTLQTDVQTAQSTADAAKTQAETNAATFADYVKTADLKGLVDQYIKEYLATSGSGNSGSSGGDSGGDTGGGTFSYGSLTPGVISTMNIPKNNNGYIKLTELGCKISEDQIINNQVHFYVMPGSTAVGDYVAKNYPEGLPIPMSFDGETEETLAYKKIFVDNNLEYPGWVDGFNNIAGDDDGTFDEISFTGYTILAGWVFGIMMD